jgi:hypothetical protein
MFAVGNQRGGVGYRGVLTLEPDTLGVMRISSERRNMPVARALGHAALADILHHTWADVSMSCRLPYTRHQEGHPAVAIRYDIPCGKKCPLVLSTPQFELRLLWLDSLRGFYS